MEKFSGPSFQWIDVTELLSTTPVKHPYLGVSAGLILRARRSIVQSWQGALVSLTSKGTLELAPLRHCGRTVREHTMWGALMGGALMVASHLAMPEKYVGRQYIVQCRCISRSATNSRSRSQIALRSTSSNVLEIEVSC